MVEPKSDYTIEELASKIETTKAELKEVKNLLAWYEEELECKKLAVPLGVPATGKFCLTYDGRVTEFLNNKQKPEDYNFNIFHSKESAEKHAEMLLDWRKDGLLANAKRELIDIKVLLPLLKKGYVAMNQDGRWFWYEYKPFKGFELWSSEGSTEMAYIGGFNIKPAENWEDSLMECGL